MLDGEASTTSRRPRQAHGKLMISAIFSWILFGFFVGLLARAVFPGNQSMGFARTTALGIIGSFLGGFFVSLVYGYPAFEFRWVGFGGSLLGAIATLAITGFGSQRRAT